MVFGLDTSRFDFGWDNTEKCKKFPGSCWIPILKSNLETAGYTVMLLSDALDKIDSAVLTPSELIVVDMDSSSGVKTLLDLGAVPAVTVNLESPLILPEHYAAIESYSQRFAHSFLFGDASVKNRGFKSDSRLRFPSYSEEQRLLSANRSQLLPRNDRNLPLISLVARYNFWRAIPSIAELARRPGRAVAGFRMNPAGRAWRKVKALQLHELRIKAIKVFKNDLIFYGGGWDSGPLPFGTRRSALLKAWKGTIGDKKKALKGAKFNFCSENCSSPGYVTEKIFDALLAGTVPVYFGAPDIGDFVPREAFIDGPSFSSLRALRRYLKGMDPATYLQLLGAGRDFLRSEAGRVHTFEHFAGQLTRAVVSVVESTTDR